MKHFFLLVIVCCGTLLVCDEFFMPKVYKIFYFFGWCKGVQESNIGFGCTSKEGKPKTIKCGFMKKRMMQSCHRGNKHVI